MWASSNWNAPAPQSPSLFSPPCCPVHPQAWRKCPPCAVCVPLLLKGVSCFQNALGAVCVTPEKGLRGHSNLCHSILRVWFTLKQNWETQQQKDLISKQDTFLRRHKAAFVLTVLKYSVFFWEKKSVYSVSLAKKIIIMKKKPVLWHLNFYKGFLVPNKYKDLFNLLFKP